MQQPVNASTPAATAASRRSTARALLAPPAAGIVISFLFVLLMASGFHAPRPHSLPVGLTAPPAAASGIRGGLAGHARGAFDLRSYTSAATLRQAVADGDVVGGLAVEGGEATIYTAGAQGAATGQAVTAAFGSTAQAAGMRTQVVDVAPLPAGDSFGLSGFMVVVGLTIAGTVFAATAFVTGRRLGGRQLVGATVLFSLLAGVTAALAVDTTVGALGRFWVVAGIGALLALAVGATVLALGRALSAPGLGLGALLVALTSISTSGSVVGYRFEPAFHRALSQWLPAGSAVEALRSVLYFGGHHAAGRLAVLAVWAAGALIVLLTIDTVRAHVRSEGARSRLEIPLHGRRASA